MREARLVPLGKFRGAVVPWSAPVPVGLGVAQPHIHALPVPETAARVHKPLAHILDDPAVRTTELTVCAQVPQAANRSPFYAALAEPVHSHVTTLES